VRLEGGDHGLHWTRAFCDETTFVDGWSLGPMPLDGKTSRARLWWAYRGKVQKGGGGRSCHWKGKIYLDDNYTVPKRQTFRGGITETSLGRIQRRRKREDS